MANDILKEAIADAKAVREVALANAKAALEEAFTPKLQSMLSAKLSEELNEEEDLDENYMDEEMDETYMDEEMDETYMDEEMDETTGMEMEGDLDEEIDLEEILNELELEEGDDSKEETVDEAKDEDLDEAKDKDEDTMDEAKDEDLDEAKKDEEEDKLDEARPIYKAEEANDPTYKAEYVNEDKDFNLDALLEEINNLDENEEDEVNEEVEEAFGNVNPVTGGSFGGKNTDVSDNLRDLAKSASSYEDWQAKAKAAGAHPNIINSDRWKAYVEKAITAEGMYEALKTELEETKAALEVKTTELNEVNLLNSKLLYVNRIFKANTLDEGQKLRVVETLDKAESAKEAKLIYETIKDTFDVAKSKKASAKSKTKSLKENFGMASKAAGTSTAPKKEVIAESDNMVNRFQKLANIKINQ